MVAKAKIGRVRFVPVREVWAHEATSFTPWLLDNEKLLGDLLGIVALLRKFFLDRPVEAA